MASAPTLAASPAPGSEEHLALVALAAGLVLILLLLLISLVTITLLWRRTGRHRRHLERDVAGLRAKVDGLEDLWSEAGKRYGTGASTAKRTEGRLRGGDAPRPGGRSLDPRSEDDDPPPPGF